ncbi:peptidyl-prolyl cis-trans isomerase [Tanacetum coccineum]
MGLFSCFLVYMFMSVVLRPSEKIQFLSVSEDESVELVDNNGGCFECCDACKAMCNGKDGPCLCDSWVFCGNPDACGSKYGEGIVKMETQYGSLHIKAPFGPPFALVQGTLEAEGVLFKKIPTEECPIIQRGSVAWIGSGPEFFISLANHEEWKKSYTVFGYVLPEDMEIAEKIATLPTVPVIDEMEFHFLFLSLLAIISLLYVVVTKSFILLASAAKRTLYYLGSKMMFKDQILNSFEYRILIRSEMRFIDEILISYECRVLIILPSCSMMLSFSFVNGCSGVFASSVGIRSHQTRD